MYEIVEAFHKATRIESSWAFIVIVALCTGIIGGFFAWVVDAGYRNSAEYKADHPSGTKRPDDEPKVVVVDRFLPNPTS
jgi:hypothetical protein